MTGDRTIRVMVVDDHPVLRQGLTRLLRLENDIAVVAEAAEDPAGITPATLRKAASRRKAGKAKAARPVRFRVPGWIIVATPNRKATGPVSEALAAAMAQAQDDGRSEAA